MIHIFDVDYTVLKKPSAWYFLREAMRQGVVGLSQIGSLPFEWIRYKLGIPNQDFIEGAVKHIAGIERDTLEEIAAACFDRRMKPDIYAAAAALIREAQGRGEQVLFATSSFHIMIRPLERFFGIEESIASTLEFSKGKTTGRIAGVSFFGAKKKTAVEDWLGGRGLRREAVRFYSDSYTDIPLMEISGQAVAVNPDRILAREAKKRGWEIMRFRETLGVGGVDCGL